MPNKTYGTVSADKQKEMTGLEFVQGLADGTLPLNTMAGTLGYDVTEAENGRVVVIAEPDGRPSQSGRHGARRPGGNDARQLHGSRHPIDPREGTGSTTLEFKISFVRPITPETGLIRAEGTVLNRGRRVGIAEGRVTDSKGRLLVHGNDDLPDFRRLSARAMTPPLRRKIP